MPAGAMTRPFSKVPPAEWVTQNDLAFAIRDKFPVTEGHTLVIPHRPVATWFEATPEEQGAIFALVDEVKARLDEELQPDGYNVGFNAGEAAGQTVMDGDETLDARFELERRAGRLRLVFHSRGGTGGSDAQRNADYGRGLERILERLRDAGATIRDAFVDSTKLRDRPTAERRLQDDELSYPLTIGDAQQARRALGRAMARVGREPGAKGGGNATKRIALELDWPGGEGLEEIAARLRGDGAEP